MLRPTTLLLRTSTLLLAVVLVLGFVLGLAWLLTAQRHAETNQQALQTLQQQTLRLAHLDTLLVRLLDAESSVRGFMITNNPVYLGSYQDGGSEVERTLAELRSDRWSDGTQRASFEQLAQLVEGRWKLLTANIERGAVSPTDGASGGIGKQMTDDIRRLVDRLRAETEAEMNATLFASFGRFAEARKTTNVMGMGVLVLLLTVVVLLYRQEGLRNRLATVLQSENRRLQEEVDARTEELRNLASYLTEAREAEQARVARELHDELGALLTAVKLDAGWIARKLPADEQDSAASLRRRFDHLLDTLNEVITIKRRVVADLRPPLLSDLGLVEALRSLTQSWRSGDDEWQIELTLPEALPELPAATSLALYRIAQEALTNARRHASADHVRLNLDMDDGQLVLRIEDDGSGFDSSARELNRHGLAGIAHRIQMLGGQLTIDSKPGQGTCIEARVPIAPEA
ncbi:MAG: CHASE3 domain-containing protein [Thauera sp.]|nr:CHASE3 domain-containing protein [Thauera sp.]